MRLPKKWEERIKGIVTKKIYDYGRKEIKGIPYKMNFLEAQELADKFMNTLGFVLDIATIFAFGFVFFVIFPKWQGMDWERIQTVILFIILVTLFFGFRKKS